MALVTGSSGFVASVLVPGVRKTDKVIGVDLTPNEFTNWVMDISSTAILESLKSKELHSGLYHFGGNICCSWAEFSQAIFDEVLELKVIASKPNVVAITTKDFPTLAKRPAQSQLNSDKLKVTFGVDPSDFMLGIRSSLTAINNEMHLAPG